VHTPAITTNDLRER